MGRFLNVLALLLVFATFTVVSLASAQSLHPWDYDLEATTVADANPDGYTNPVYAEPVNNPWKDGDGPVAQNASITGVVARKNGPITSYTAEASSFAKVAVNPRGGSMVVQKHAHTQITAHDDIYGARPDAYASATTRYEAVIPDMPDFNLIVKWTGSDESPNGYGINGISQVTVGGIPGTTGFPVNWPGPYYGGHVSGQLATGVIPFSGNLIISASVYGGLNASTAYGGLLDADDGSPWLSVTWSFNGYEPGDPRSPWWVDPQMPNIIYPFTYPAGDNGIGTVKPLYTVTPFELTPSLGQFAVKYEVNGPKIATFLVPDALGGDEDFSISFNGESFNLHAGQIFDFLPFYAGGIEGFTLNGIDPGTLESLELGGAFTFVSAGDVTLLVTQVPEPSSFVLASFCLFGLLAWFKRRER